MWNEGKHELSFAKLCGSEVTGVRLPKEMKGVDLSDTNLTRVDFMSGTDLSQSNLCNANLAGVKLQGLLVCAVCCIVTG